MQRLIKLLAYRLIFHRRLQVATMIYAGFAFLIIGGVYALGSFPVGEQQIPLTNFFIRPYVWQNLAVFASIGNYFLALLVILVVTGDIQTRMLRQQVVAGLTRTELSVGYILFGFVAAFISLLILVGLGLAFSDAGTSFMNTDTARVFGLFLLQGFGLFLFAILVSVISASGVGAALIFLGWTLIGESLLGVALDHYLHQSSSQYLPFQTLSSLIPSPAFIGEPGVMAVSGAMVGLGVGYCSVFAGAIWMKLRFSDL